MTTTKQINLRIEDDLLAQLDNKRGLISRNAWITWAIEQALPLTADSERRTPPIQAESQVPAKRPELQWGGIGGKPPIQKKHR